MMSSALKSVKSSSKVCVRPASSGARASSSMVVRASAVPRSTSSAKSSSKGVRGDVRVFGEYGASSTSFYTTTEKQDSYDSLEVVLGTKCADTQMRTLIVEMLDAIADITEALRSALVTVEGSSNTFGDAQLSVDVIADEIMWNKCRESSTVAFGASEEEPEVKPCNPNGEYTVCWDPLDGSSIVDNNWAVGTMIGVWGSKSGSGDDGLIGATGRDQVTSLIALYGPRTTVLVGLDDGVYEFSYGCTPDGCQLADGTFAPWICSRSQITISEECKIFAPANLRATKEVEGYKKLVDYYMQEKYTLRYSGGLVPDVYQQFTKQQGVFSNPTSDSSPAKLRLAFEAAPFGLLVEKAGGKTSDGVTGGSVLDVQINQVDQRTALCIGSSKEVDRFNEMICMVE
uniref:Fructose-bisphosphatase n=2 Tax=Pycnococcus provasolii TaxID=41880 RepID=A0A7S2FDL5_9CHLO|mmetsp:Transcript_5766/g.13212  ORF Transcript_5766/g.13212 Transcript_5766/m.13212 type:complete len:400 (+) Transcript_5766:42-1241(+)